MSDKTPNTPNLNGLDFPEEPNLNAPNNPIEERTAGNINPAGEGQDANPDQVMGPNGPSGEQPSVPMGNMADIHQVVNKKGNRLVSTIAAIGVAGAATLGIGSAVSKDKEIAGTPTRSELYSPNQVDDPSEGQAINGDSIVIQSPQVPSSEPAKPTTEDQPSEPTTTDDNPTTPTTSQNQPSEPSSYSSESIEESTSPTTASEAADPSSEAATPNESNAVADWAAQASEILPGSSAEYPGEPDFGGDVSQSDVYADQWGGNHLADGTYIDLKRSNYQPIELMPDSPQDLLEQLAQNINCIYNSLDANLIRQCIDNITRDAYDPWEVRSDLTKQLYNMASHAKLVRLQNDKAIITQEFNYQGNDTWNVEFASIKAAGTISDGSNGQEFLTASRFYMLRVENLNWNPAATGMVGYRVLSIDETLERPTSY